jgi:ligand-binding sensor domain-containing protein
MKAMLLLLLQASTLVLAQQPPLYFEKVGVQNGLSHNKVNCILQDKRGFIWLCTDDDLNRYDGKRFLHFRHRSNDIITISGNIISNLLEDKEGILWIATLDGGLSHYDFRQPPSKQFRQYLNRPNKSSSIPVNTVTTLLNAIFFQICRYKIDVYEKAIHSLFMWILFREHGAK